MHRGLLLDSVVDMHSAGCSWLYSTDPGFSLCPLHRRYEAVLQRDTTDAMAAPVQGVSCFAVNLEEAVMIQQPQGYLVQLLADDRSPRLLTSLFAAVITVTHLEPGRHTLCNTRTRQRSLRSAPDRNSSNGIGTNSG